jgi:alpha-tubulin suppressor-like RCC1 family protein
MSQDIFDSIDPAISGTDLAGVLNLFKDAIVSGLSGPTRPTELEAGGVWVDTSGDPTTWVLRLWTGTDDVEIISIDLATGASSVSLAVDSFIVRKVSADAVGAILELVKRRIATNGQVLTGDVVGEVRYVGRDNTGGNPIVAKIMFTAAENQTSSAFGGTLSFYSTPAGQNSLVEHMRFINGQIETIVPHKTNAEVLTGQNIATAATIAQLSADKVLVEFTGATATDVQGLNSSHASKVVHLHNRSSAVVTLKNQDLGAIAADRLLFPDGRDIEMNPQESVALYYCVADTRWKALYASARFAGFTVDTLRPNVNSWVAPTATTKVRVMAKSKRTPFFKGSAVPNMMTLDQGGSIFAWGRNGNGSLGVGNTTGQASPTAVLRNFKFVEIGSSGTGFSDGSSVARTPQGVTYAWGLNDFGQLGLEDVIPRSSPVAVVGTFTFQAVHTAMKSMIGLTTNGLAYAWGRNSQGELGDNTTVAKSSPVAVVGGNVFQKLFTLPSNDLILAPSMFGLTPAGALYAWGYNVNGQLGLGDVVSRSSPVAVLGGLVFKEVVVGNGSVYAMTEDGTLYAWGDNLSGQLGLGDRVARSSPVAVVGGLKFNMVAPNLGGSSRHVIGITTAGAIYAWGDNTNGALGDNTVAHKSSPVAVVGGIVAKKVLASLDTVYALSEDGVAYAWGYEGNSGEHGQGSANSPRSSPVAVTGGFNFQDITSIEGAASTGIGVTWDGKLYSWGNNANGERGVGDTSIYLSPMLVVGNLSMKTQDDSDTVLDIPVVGGNTYSLRLGSGPCFFGQKPIGSDIEEVEVSYIE